VRNGFTLIEVVAAVAVAALVLVATYGVTTTTIAVQRRTENVLGVRREGAAILDLVCEDLFCAVHRDKDESFVLGEDSDPRPFSFIGLAWDPESGRRIPAEIGYDYERKDAKLLLYRRSAKIEDSIQDGGEGILVSDEIRSWKVEVFDGEEWLDTWEATKSLPVAVRIEFSLDVPDGEPVSFTRAVVLPSSDLIEPVKLPEPEEVPL
jgi:type II secretion system protein J